MTAPKQEHVAWIWGTNEVDYHVQDVQEQVDMPPQNDQRSEVKHISATETQSQVAYRVIEEMIVTLQIPPGSIVSEKSLSRQLDIGRTPIREALQRLALEGDLTGILDRAE